MRRRICVPTIASLFALGFGIAAADDSFLDRPFPEPAPIKSTLLLNEIKSIDPAIGKKIIFPPGFVDYITRNRFERGGMTISLPKKGNFTIRDYLNEKASTIAHLRWHYDAAQDAIVFDFGWHRPPSRPASELVNQLQSSSPRPLGDAIPHDPWEVCVNDLMSEPENFPHTWKVRLEDGHSTMQAYDANSEIFGFEAGSAHLLSDSTGNRHLLILNYHAPLVTPGPSPAFAFYLFTADGKWEDGGTFEAGNTFSLPKTIFEPDKNRVTIEMIDKPIIFTSMDGKNTKTIINPDRKRAVYHDYLTVENGKLAATFLKDEKPLTTEDYAMDVTPLHHLGD